MSYYYKSYYYNKYNKQIVNDDNNDERSSRSSSFYFNSCSSGNYNYFGLSYGLTFFLDRRLHHYKVINDLIFSPIINIKNGYDKSCLFDYLRFNELGDLNGVVYDDAKIHLEKHRRTLPQEIEGIQPRIKEHNLDVNKLEKMISDFIDCNYILSPPFPYNSIFPYRFNAHIKSQSLQIWLDSIKNIKKNTDIIEFKKNIDIQIAKSNIMYSGEHNHILNIKGHEVGNGIYENSAQEVVKIFTTRLKNDEILQKLVYLVNNNLDIKKKIDIIVNDVRSISESIERGYYDKKLSCCPQLFKLPRLPRRR